MRILLIYVRNNQTYLQHKQVQQMFQVHYEIAKTHLNEQSLPLFYKYITDIDFEIPIQGLEDLRGHLCKEIVRGLRPKKLPSLTSMSPTDAMTGKKKNQFLSILEEHNSSQSKRIVLARETMMEALICDVSLANAKIIDKLLFEDIKTHDDEQIPRCYLAYDPRNEKERFFANFLIYCLARQANPLEFALTQASAQMKKGLTEEAALLVRPFHLLKPLFLILSYDTLLSKDLRILERLMESVWVEFVSQPTNLSSSSMIHSESEFCEYLFYYLKLSRWFSSNVPSARKYQDEKAYYTKTFTEITHEEPLRYFFSKLTRSQLSGLFNLLEKMKFRYSKDLQNENMHLTASLMVFSVTYSLLQQIFIDLFHLEHPDIETDLLKEISQKIKEIPLPHIYLVILLKILEKLLSLRVGDINTVSRVESTIGYHERNFVADRKIVYLIFDICEEAIKQLASCSGIPENDQTYLGDVDRSIQKLKNKINVLKKLSKTFRFTSLFYQNKKVAEVRSKALRIYNEEMDPRDAEESSDASEFLNAFKKSKKVEFGETISLQISRFVDKLLLSELELLKLIIIDKNFDFAFEIEPNQPLSLKHSAIKNFFQHYITAITSSSSSKLTKSIESLQEDLKTLSDVTFFNDQQLDLVFFCLMLEALFLKTDSDGIIQKEIEGCLSKIREFVDPRTISVLTNSNIAFNLEKNINTVKTSEESVKESPDAQEDLHTDPNIFLKSERESEDNLVKVDLQKLVNKNQALKSQLPTNQTEKLINRVIDILTERGISFLSSFLKYLMSVSKILENSIEFPTEEYFSTYQLLLEKRPGLICQYLLQKSERYENAIEMAEIMSFNLLKKLFVLHEEAPLINFQMMSWAAEREKEKARLLYLLPMHESLLVPALLLAKSASFTAFSSPKPLNNTVVSSQPTEEQNFIALIEKLKARAAKNQLQNYINILNYLLNNYQEIKTIINKGEKPLLIAQEGSKIQEKEKKSSSPSLSDKHQQVRELREDFRDELYDLIASFTMESPFPNKDKLKKQLLAIDQMISKDKSSQQRLDRDTKRKRIEAQLKKPSFFISAASGKTSTGLGSKNEPIEPLQEFDSEITNQMLYYFNDNLENKFDALNKLIQSLINRKNYDSALLLLEREAPLNERIGEMCIRILEDPYYKPKLPVFRYILKITDGNEIYRLVNKHLKTIPIAQGVPIISHCIAVLNSKNSYENSDRLTALTRHYNFYTALLNEKPTLGTATPEEFEADIAKFDQFFENYKTEFSINLFKDLLVVFNCQPLIDNWIKIHWYFIRKYFQGDGKSKLIPSLIVSLVEHLNYQNFFTLEFEPCERDCLLQTILARILMQRTKDVHGPSEQDHKFQNMISCNSFCLELASNLPAGSSIDLFANTKDPEAILQLFIVEGLLGENYQTFVSYNYLFDEEKIIQKAYSFFDIENMEINPNKFLMILNFLQNEEKKVDIIFKCINDLLAYLKKFKAKTPITSIPNFVIVTAGELLKSQADNIAKFSLERQRTLQYILTGYTACYEFLKTLDNQNRHLLALPQNIEDTQTLEGILGEFIDRDELRIALRFCKITGLRSPKVAIFLISSFVRLELFEKAKDALVTAYQALSKSNQKHLRKKIVWATVCSFDDIKYGETRGRIAELLDLLQRMITDSANETEKTFKYPFENEIQRKMFNNKKSEFEKKKYEMCLNYINTYGDETLLTEFYLRNGHYKEACRLVFGKSIPEKVFVTNVLSYFIERDMLDTFLQILREIDPKMVHSRKYLEYSCQYLEKEKLQSQLLAIQLFLAEYSKVAKQNLEFYKEAQELPKKIQFLSQAEKNFQQSLKHEKEPIYTRDEIKKMLELISLQKEILQTFPDLKDLSIFSENEVKLKICEVISLQDPYFALKIIHVLAIDFKKFTKDLVLKRIANDELIELDTFIQAISKNQSTGESGNPMSTQDWDLILIVCAEKLHAKKQFPDFIREKILPKLSSDFRRVEVLRLIGDFEKADHLQQAIEEQKGKRLAQGSKKQSSPRNDAQESSLAQINSKGFIKFVKNGESNKPGKK